MRPRQTPLDRKPPDIPADYLTARSRKPADGGPPDPVLDWSPPYPWVLVWVDRTTPLWFRQPGVVEAQRILTWAKQEQLRAAGLLQEAQRVRAKIDGADDPDGVEIDADELAALMERTAETQTVSYAVHGFIVGACWAHPSHEIESYHRYLNQTREDPYPKRGDWPDVRLSCGLDIVEELEGIGLPPGAVVRCSREIQRLISMAQSFDPEEASLSLDFSGAPTATRPV